MLAAIGQLAAVFVGIPSLIYLAVQIREQTKERRQSAVNALTAQWGDLTCALHDSGEFCSIFLRGCIRFDDLDAISKLRFSAFFNRFLKNFRRNVFLPLRRRPERIFVGRDRADHERFHCLPRITAMVGDEKALAHGRICPRSGRNHRQRRRAQGLLNLQSTRDCRAEDTRMN